MSPLRNPFTQRLVEKDWTQAWSKDFKPKFLLDSEKQSLSSFSSVLCTTRLHQEAVQPTEPASSAMLHNVSSSKGVVYTDTALKGQDRDRERVWGGVEGAQAPNTSSLFPPEPPGASSNIIPVYCALLAAVVLGLLAYVAFKCWRSHKQRQQLAKARTVELGDPDRDQRHGDSSVFVDSPHCLEPCIPSQGLHSDLGCRLYLHIPKEQQEEVEQLLMLGEPGKGWQGLAGHLGYQAEAVEIMARGQTPAYTLLRDWAAQEGSRATLRVLEDALTAIGREDVVQVLGSPAEGCSVV
ncbi:death domain-containing membrane protein NRADD-like [Sigmodon hispidus]